MQRQEGVEEGETATPNIWEPWKDLCGCTTSDCLDANIVVLYEQVWADFNKVFQLKILRNTTEEEQHKQFQEGLKAL